jgi:signal transduction histidine kinase
MISANIPPNEAEILDNLNSYNILDTLPEKEFDAITKIASGICNTPIALVSIIDQDWQWFKSNHGLDSKQTSRDFSFCAHDTLKPDELVIVNDTSKDERFRNNTLTSNIPNIVFYVGAPLNSSEGFPLGTLCVIDNEPKELSEDQKESLKLLAKQVVTLLELRKKNKELAESNQKNLKLNEQLNDFAFRLTHDLKSPINGVSFLLDVLKEDYLKLYQNTKVEDYLNLISNRINYMDNLVNEIFNYTKVTSENLIYKDFNLKKLLDSIITNIDFKNKILLNPENLNFEISSSKIGILQIFQNLISNSIKFGDEEKVVIDVIFKEEEEEYHFTYMDNGPGIEKEYREKVFQMFETLDNTDNNNTGIGLTTVKSIINRLGGKIYLDDREDNKKGVCFYFYISKTNNN